MLALCFAVILVKKLGIEKKKNNLAISCNKLKKREIKIKLFLKLYLEVCILLSYLLMVIGNYIPKMGASKSEQIKKENL